MKGYPKFLSSKADYEYVRNHFSKEEWLPDFQGLLDSSRDWFFVSELSSETEGVEDDTHKVVKDEQQNKIYQYELQLNPTCKLLRLGFTEDEVKNIIKNA